MIGVILHSSRKINAPLLVMFHAARVLGIHFSPDLVNYSPINLIIFDFSHVHVSLVQPSSICK